MKHNLIALAMLISLTLPGVVSAQDNAVPPVPSSSPNGIRQEEVLDGRDAILDVVDVPVNKAVSECSINGESVDCGVLKNKLQALPFVKYLPLIALSIFLITAVLTFFWLAMFIACLTDKQNTSKVLWIVIFLLFGPLAALIYLFVRKTNVSILPVNQTGNNTTSSVSS
jgi:hypothetical protein